MKPRMDQLILFRTQVNTGETDRYGNPILEDDVKEYPARVQKKVNLVEGSDRRVTETNLEIDTVTDAPVKADMNIEYVDAEGVQATGTIKAIGGPTNFAGNRLLWKVLYVDG